MNYYIALFEKIKELYKNQSSNDSEIPLICPSLRIFENHEMSLLLPQILIKEELKGEAILKKQDISYQLNSIPSNNNFWDINPNNPLFDVYNKIINVKQIGKIVTDELQHAQTVALLYDLNGKPTKEKRRYDKFINLYEIALTEWKDHLMKFADLVEENDKQLWFEKLNNIVLKKEQLIVKHKIFGNKQLIENAISKINDTDGYDSFLSSLVSARSNMEFSSKTGIESLEAYHDINFVPYNFMSSENGWIKISLDKKELNNLYNISNIKIDNLPEEIISFDYDEENILGIELEFSIISLLRSWFNLSPLLSPFFNWNNSKTVSNGRDISIDYLLPAYPKKMILIKNLKINLQDIETKIIEKTTQAVRFGPIVMKNQIFINEKTDVKFLKAIRNKDLVLSENFKYLNSKSQINNLTNMNLQENTGLESIKVKESFQFNKLEMQTEKRFTISTKVLAPVLLKLEAFENLITIIVNVKDDLNSQPIYKSEISIIGITNNYFIEIETNKEGFVNFKLPVGDYKIKITKNGYEIFENNLNIENLNTLIKDYKLKALSVSYDSFFLIGMICEKLPQIPVI